MSVIAYDCTPARDGKTGKLQEAVKAANGLWKNVSKMSEQELAALVREDGVDILVELTGHTANNRLGVMAQRPAPIQVSSLTTTSGSWILDVDDLRYACEELAGVLVC